MRKAFLFDMDGVLADSERAWINGGYEKILIEHFGQELHDKVKFDSGLSIKGIFDAYVQVGFIGDYADFHVKNIAFAQTIYPQLALTEGLEACIDYLDEQGYVLGIVSSSPKEWIGMLISRLSNRDKFQIIVSVNNHPTLRSKPAPDPYVHAMQLLGVTPEQTWALEDSQAGVTAGRASGAKVICFTAYHNKDIVRPLADYYAKSMAEVRQIVDKSDKA